MFADNMPRERVLQTLRADVPATFRFEGRWSA